MNRSPCGLAHLYSREATDLVADVDQTAIGIARYSTGARGGIAPIPASVPAVLSDLQEATPDRGIEVNISASDGVPLDSDCHFPMKSVKPKESSRVSQEQLGKDLFCGVFFC